MSSFQKLLKQLEKGELPDELNFSNDITDNSLNLSKVQYNTFYRNRDFILGRFPLGFDKLPASNMIINSIVENLKSPLEEMLERQDIINENDLKE